MTPDGFRTRLAAADLTAEEFAEIVQVDPKTVQRWVAGRVPQRRHRAKVARALDSSPDVLWPDTTATEPGELADDEPGPQDVIASWGQADDEGAPDLATFVSDGDGPVELLDGGGQLLRSTGLMEALLVCANASTDVRVVTGPATEPRRLVDAGVEVRVADLAGAPAVLRAGERMLVTLVLSPASNEPRPMLELGRRADGGLFDRFADYLDSTWEDASVARRVPGRDGTTPGSRPRRGAGPVVETHRQDEPGPGLRAARHPARPGPEPTSS